ncbi:MAG: GAF domain-containing protein [Syntrophaceae bacterium]|nr:GAF domain-containing protein [Syntrophaceae bacterium]
MKQEDKLKQGNEEIARRFTAIKNKLNGASDIAGMLEILFDEVENEFQIPFVWLTLIDENKNATVIEAVKSSDKLKTRLNLISRAVFDELLKEGVKPVLINNNLKPYYKLFPQSKKYFAKSMAIVPLRLNDEIIGSWNNGDVSPERYSPDMDTDILEHFANLISNRLTEIANIAF